MKVPPLGGLLPLGGLVLGSLHLAFQGGDARGFSYALMGCTWDAPK